MSTPGAFSSALFEIGMPVSARVQKAVSHTELFKRRIGNDSPIIGLFWRLLFIDCYKSGGKISGERFSSIVVDKKHHGYRR